MSRGFGSSVGMELWAAAATLALAAAAYWAVATLVAPRLRLRHLPGPNGHLVYGSLCEWIDRGPIECASEWRARFGSVVKFFLVVHPMVLVFNPDAVGEVLNNVRAFPGRPMAAMLNSNPRDLLFAIGPYYKMLRCAWAPMFTRSRLRDCSEGMKAAAEGLVRKIGKLEEGQRCEFLDLSRRLTMEVILQSGFGLNSNIFGDSFDYVATRVMKLMALQSENSKNRAFRLMVHLFKIPIQKVLRFAPNSLRSAVSFVNKMFETLLHNHKDKLRPASSEKDFISLMLKAQGKQKDWKLTDDDILQNCRLFLVAGYETTAGSLAIAVYYISKFSDVQQKLLAEIDMYNDGGPVSVDDLEHYKYTEWVVNEAMRMHGIVPQTMRTAAHDFYLKGKVFIPKGTAVVLPIHILHHEASLWGDPENFRPERFDEASEEHKKRHPYAFLPFGAGTRMCIGYKFALMEIKLALIAIYRRFTFTVDCERTRHPLRMAYYITNQPVDGIHLKVHKRVAA